MIPLRDTIPSRNCAVANLAIIGVNVVVFLVQMVQGPHIEQFMFTYGLVPARYSVPFYAAHFTLGQQLFSLVSFMFLHGGFWHLLGNMWFLYIFGDNVEDRLGSFSYLAFFLIAGLISGLFHLIINIHSPVPTIGASGAIAGVMGAYLVLFPNARILTLIPIIFIPWIVEIPAFFFLGLWFVLQVASAGAGQAYASGIAWWAHIGGFLFGIIAMKAFGVKPGLPAGARKRPGIARKRTERIQVLRPVGPPDEINIYDVLKITPYEATAGARKMVAIPWGFYSRSYNIVIPSGIREGNILRLKGLGKLAPGGERGDLFLKIKIDQPWQ